MRRASPLVALAAATAFPGCASAACDPTALAGPSLTQCLAAEEKASSDKVQAAYKAAVASIATRPGVFDAQRARWRNSLAESHDLWLRLRNAECQNVAPFEGQAASTSVVRNRMAAFEAKLACAIRMNDMRAADLSSRYPPAGPSP
jgi:uncharacterized protein YecT (DUF1311 family)